MLSFEWVHLAIGVASAAFGAVGGLVAGVWRVARIEQGIRDDYVRRIGALKDDIEVKVESLVGQFQDTFAALRQKINDVELQTEKLFMSKDGFNDFRREYREDMSNLMAKIDHITMRADRK